MPCESLYLTLSRVAYHNNTTLPPPSHFVVSSPSSLTYNRNTFLNCKFCPRRRTITERHKAWSLLILQSFNPSFDSSREKRNIVPLPPKFSRQSQPRSLHRALKIPRPQQTPSRQQQPTQRNFFKPPHPPPHPPTTPPLQPPNQNQLRDHLGA